MREVCFKGKRTDNAEWVQGYLTKRKFAGKEYFAIEQSERRIVTYDYENVMQPYGVIPETVGQYTGLTDKKGRKIFEGDKCRVTRHCILCYGFITFKNGSFWFDEFNTDSVLELSKLKINNFEIEVIGNIHDNPELLEVAE